MSEPKTHTRRSVLKRSALAALASAPMMVSSSGVAGAESLSGPTGIHVAHGPDPTSSMMVAWSGPPAGDVSVRYAKPGGSETTARASGKPVPGKNLVAYHAGLFGLASGSEYTYEVVMDGTRSTKHTFTTAPESGDSFRVTAVGDHGIDDPDNEFQRANTDDPIEVIDSAKGMDPAFHLGVGDISYANGYPFTWDYYFDAFEDFYAETPFMTVPGNHEKEPGTGFAQYDARLNEVMVNTDPTLRRLDSKQRWHDFTYGNTLFMGLNTSADACGDYLRGEEFVPFQDTRCRTDESYAYNERQGSYIEETLRGAENDADTEWKIAYFHSSLWTDGDHDARTDLRDMWGGYFDEYNVDLVLAGHNHSYERSKPIVGDSAGEYGTTYLVNGTGGTSHYGFQHEIPPEWTAFRDHTHFGVTRLDIDGDSIDVRYVAEEGTVIDAFSIVKEDGKPTQTTHNDAVADSLVVTGSRTDDGSVFTGGQTDQIDLTVEMANDEVTIRDLIPAEWNVVAGDATRTEPGSDGSKYVYFDDLDPSNDPHVTYFVEAPTGATKTGEYTFGPFEANGVSFDTWMPVQGTDSTETVVGEST